MVTYGQNNNAAFNEWEALCFAKSHASFKHYEKREFIALWCFAIFKYLIWKSFDCTVY